MVFIVLVKCKYKKNAFKIRESMYQLYSYTVYMTCTTCRVFLSINGIELNIILYTFYKQLKDKIY